MNHEFVKRFAGGVQLYRSPSPRPSPAGRGRIALNLTKNHATEFAGYASEKSEAHACCPLSQRERVRVREKFQELLNPCTTSSPLEVKP
jgi:hypothetical protein